MYGNWILSETLMNNVRQPRLRVQIALQIGEMIRDGRLKVGEHLSAQKLADEFHVSRQPVKDALKILEDSGIVESQKNRAARFHRRSRGPAAPWVNLPGRRAYFRIAEDRLTGRCRRGTETDLRRTTDHRAENQGMLARMVQRWIVRKPVRGVSARPHVAGHCTSIATSSACHRAAALSGPTYAADRPRSADARTQVGMLDGQI